jgi:predicted transcriptional regulator
MKHQWRVDSTAELAWRHWDGEYVVHHALSNDTHRLSDFAGHVLLQLAACPAPVSCATLAETLDADDEDVAETLKALAEVGFVQAC